MSYAVLLHFDPFTESKVQELIHTIAAHTGLSDQIPLGFRPHITLTGFEPPLPDGLKLRLEDLASRTDRIPIHLASVGTFPGEEGVVFLSPAANPELLRLHQNIYQLLTELSVETNPYFNPGTWVPHCSVAYNLNPEQACRAVQHCLGSQVFNRGELVSLGLTEFLPIKEICIYPLNR